MKGYSGKKRVRQEQADITKLEYTKDLRVPDPSSSPLLQSKALHAYRKPAANAKMYAGEFSLN